VNDQQQPYGPNSYDPYYGGSRIVGYDQYGRPVYEQPGGGQAPGPQSPAQGQGYAPYDTGAQPTVPGPQPGVPGSGQGQGPSYGYDPYGQAQQPPPQGPPGPPGTGAASASGAGIPESYDPYGQQGRQSPGVPGNQFPGGADGYGYDYGTGQQPAVDTTQWNIPQQAPPQAPRQPPQQPPQQPFPTQGPDDAPMTATGRQSVVPEQRSVPGDAYHTGQFSFIEEPDEDSEDVIDWLKFTESRTERREEARRRGRHRLVALFVVLAVAVVGGAGYLWYAGKLPGLDAPTKKQATAPGGPQKRDVIVVHLHDTADRSTSTALLINNETTGEGSTLLLPGSLTVSNDDGTVTTLAKSVEEDGSDGTREAIGNLLGTKVAGTWRLDTPYLENLVDIVGNVDVDTDTDVPDTKKGAPPVVHKGKDQTLSGKMAVAYATYHAPGESDDKQLQRFGQVMQATFRKMSSDPKTATVTVQTLAQILDPSLTDKELGAALATLADHAKQDHYKTAVLPVGQDGTLTAQGKDVVKQFLGGSVKPPDSDGVLRIGVKNDTGDTAATEAARVTLVNAGYTVLDSGSGTRTAESTITYADASDKAQASEVAKTLGLPAGAVKKCSAGNADVAVVLGADYTPPKPGDS
jgi:anionic cell wall polymer biosynthesis LytR-Cps2A-Psr (LCP) family protein